MLKLRSIYSPHTPIDVLEFLYSLLAERDATTNISHRRMPTFDRHADFVASRPYREWWTIEDDGILVGAAYLSDQNEIGIFLSRPYQGRGIGPRVIDMIISRHKHEDLLANVNPENARSEKMFMSKGFGLLQKTFVRRASN